MAEKTAFAKNKGVAATDSTIEHVLFVVDGAGFGDELDDDGSSFELIADVVVFVNLPTVCPLVGLRIVVIGPGDVVLP